MAWGVVCSVPCAMLPCGCCCCLYLRIYFFIVCYLALHLIKIARAYYDFISVGLIKIARARTRKKTKE